MHVELGDAGFELRHALGRFDRQLLQFVPQLREARLLTGELLRQRALALDLGEMGVLSAPHFHPGEIALAGQLDRTRARLTGNFDTFALDFLLPR